ncbi:MAG TPA: hypothetical protein VGU90_01970 [Terriglobales bacterium]|nr:hypothetical protein [Terriglobales bacterium]
MDRPLREHIDNLQSRILRLGEQVMDNNLTQEERNKIQSEIWAAELALNHYRKALELEQKHNLGPN